MINILKKYLEDVKTREEKISRLREFLQVLVLKITYDKGYFKNLAFIGGTALRLLYNLKRFSEDLDFSLINKKGFDFERFISVLLNQLKKYGFDTQANLRAEPVVKNAILKFNNILYDLNLSDIQAQKLFIRIEVDTNPPGGYKTEVSLISNVFVFTVTQFDIPSLYSTKLHACFFRKYTKGRDFYDLFWYLGRNIKPNLKLLNNAISQTEKYNPEITEKNFKIFLKKELNKVDFKKVKKDVERFLIDKSELKLFEKRAAKKLIESL